MQDEAPAIGRKPKYRRRKAFSVAMAASVAVPVILTACSSSKSNAGSPSNTASATGSASTQASGTPIKVMEIDDVTGNVYPNPAIVEGGKATVADINANGGVSGHPIKLSICDSQGDPNKTAACGREAVSSGVVAVVGSYAANVARLMPVLSAAKIPYIGGYGLDPTEFNTPISYNLESVLAVLPAFGILAGEKCKSTALAIADGASVDFTAAFINAALKAAGKPALTVIKVPVTPGDFTAQAAQIVGTKADCVVALLSIGEELSLYPALEAAGSTQRLLASPGTLTAAVISKVPKLTANALVVSNFAAYDSPKWDAYRTIVGKYSDTKKFDFSGSGPQLAYLAFTVFKQVAQKALASSPDLTAASLIATLDKTTDVDTGGLLPPIDFSKKAPVKGFPQMFVRAVAFQTVTDGKFISLDNDQFHDTTTYLQGILGTA